MASSDARETGALADDLREQLASHPSALVLQLAQAYQRRPLLLARPFWRSCGGTSLSAPSMRCCGVNRKCVQHRDGCEFRSTLSVVEIHESARKHGIADEDIQHAIDHALAIEDAGEDPDRWLGIGPDRAGKLLEVVVLVTIEGTQIAIHAMRMRTKFRRLIEP
jgi:hypothetical protein